MKIKIISFFIIAITLLSCDVTQEFTGNYNMIKCDYKYRSVTGLSLNGINVKKNISAANAAAITTVFSNGASSIPLAFTTNINVTNPHKTTALMQRFDYIVSIDGIQFSKGSANKRLDIPGGETRTLAVNMSTDLVTLMNNKSKNAVINIIKNITGVSSKESRITVQIKPIFVVANKEVASPEYIPISFSFGNK